MNKERVYGYFVLSIILLGFGALVYVYEVNAFEGFNQPKILYLNTTSIDPQVIRHALTSGNIVVIKGYVKNNTVLPFKLPKLVIKTTLLKIYYNRKNGNISSIVAGRRIIVTKPKYIIAIMYFGPSVSKLLLYYTHRSDRASITKTIEESQRGLYKLVSELKALETKPTGMFVSASTTISAQWIKKWESEHTWIINGEDELYTRYEIYQLNIYDEVVNKEYWRIDGYIDHNLQSYTATSSECGPYVHQRTIYMNAGQELYTYGPSTTPEDTTVSVNIGFSVSTSGASVGVSYGWSWKNPGVRYDVSAYYSQHNVKWTETFRGPDYTWWPWYSQPTSAAYNSYNSRPSAVFRTTVGSGITVNKLESTWTIYHDVDIHPVGVIIEYTRNSTTYDIYWYPFSLSSIF